MRSNGSFVPIPTLLLDALMRSRLSGRQWRILLWVMRQTYGWHRAWTLFTWYRLAKALQMDRPGAFRAGQALLEARVLVLKNNQLGVQMDCGLWDRRVFAPKTETGQQRRRPNMSVVWGQRKALRGDNETVVTKQRKRCVETTFFRRAKDSSKNKLKIYKDTRAHEDARHPSTWAENTERRLLEGAAKTIPGKYERLSQN